MTQPFTARPAAGPVSVLAYLGCSVMGLLPIGGITLAALAVSTWLSGGDLSTLTDASAGGEIPGAVLFVSMFTQFAGMLLLAVVLARAFRRDVRDALALRRFPILAAALAMVFTPVSGLFTARVSAWMIEEGLTFGTVEQLGNAVTGGTFLDQLAMGFAVVVLAPLVEELVFRGFFWDALGRAMPTWAVWLGTSLLFAAYHTDPAHVVGVMGLSLFAGWTRWRTDSVWPAVGVHWVNNVLALGLQQLVADDVPQELPWWAACAGLLVTIAAGAIVGLAARRNGVQGRPLPLNKV